MYKRCRRLNAGSGGCWTLPSMIFPKPSFSSPGFVVSTRFSGSLGAKALESVTRYFSSADVRGCEGMMFLTMKHLQTYRRQSERAVLSVSDVMESLSQTLMFVLVHMLHALKMARAKRVASLRATGAAPASARRRVDVNTALATSRFCAWDMVSASKSVGLHEVRQR